jgi:hypothetical protein
MCSFRRHVQVPTGKLTRFSMPSGASMSCAATEQSTVGALADGWRSQANPNCGGPQGWEIAPGDGLIFDTTFCHS